MLVRLPAEGEIKKISDNVVEIPEQSVLEYPEHTYRRIELPKDTSPNIQVRDGSRYLVVPDKAKLLQPPVDRWKLGYVISLAVFGICMWGTLIGSMLPLVFRSLGVDPGIASSPFVATFVDVTGIVIYFTIAKAFLLS